MAKDKKKQKKGTDHTVILWQVATGILVGVANGTSKNVGLREFWQDLEISKAFLISLEVSFLHGLLLPFFESLNFLPKSLGLGFFTRISASRQVSDFTTHYTFLCFFFPMITSTRSESPSFIQTTSQPSLLSSEDD